MSNNSIKIYYVDKIEKHPNADALGIVSIEGFTCCVALADWESRIPGLVAYIPPDSIVKTTRPEFSWLNDGKGTGTARIRVKRLRGIYSQGLLIPAPAHSYGFNVGDDVQEFLEVTHYDPPIQTDSGSETEQAPDIFSPVYDVENYNRYTECFQEGEEIIATEKIHGANARFAWFNDRLYCGSRTQWKKEGNNPWWLAIKQYPKIVEFLKANPEYVLYGEVYGAVQKLKYGCNGVKLALFDILFGNEWLSWDLTQQIAYEYNLPWVPLIYRGPFNKTKLKELAEGKSLIEGANHIREGIVIKPKIEKSNIEIGRVQLKMISNAYLEKN